MPKSSTKKQSPKNYRQMSDNLADILTWFEQESIDIDQAITKYQQALGLLDDMETYLKTAENKIKRISVKQK
jgi:exodeoxyribonuclease VII small subunit